MMVKRGMKMEEVLKVRKDFYLESVDEGIESWVGECEDGAPLCVEVEDGIVVEVVKGMWF